MSAPEGRPLSCSAPRRGSAVRKRRRTRLGLERAAERVQRLEADRLADLRHRAVGRGDEARRARQNPLVCRLRSCRAFPHSSPALGARVERSRRADAGPPLDQSPGFLVDYVEASTSRACLTAVRLGFGVLGIRICFGLRPRGPSGPEGFRDSGFACPERGRRVLGVPSAQSAVWAISGLATASLLRDSMNDALC